MQSVPITTDIVSLIPAQGDVYNIVIQFVNDLLQVWFSQSDRHDITEILLKVTLNTIKTKPM